MLDVKDKVQLYKGDCLEIMRDIPDKSVGLTTGRDEFEARPIKKYINPIQHNPNGTTYEFNEEII